MKKYINDIDVWKTPRIDEESDFVYEAQCLNGPGEKNWDIDILKSSNIARKTGDKVTDFKVNVQSYECGSGIILPIFKKKNVNTRTAALKIVKDFYRGETKDKAHPWAEMESFMKYQHYCAEMGYDIVGCEIGCCMSGYPVNMAFSRGAARQFGKSWFADFSLWGAGTEGICGNMLNYSGNFYAFNGWGEAKVCDPTGGQGVNAVRRSHLYVYMSGASWLINEAGGNNAFYPEVEEDGYYRLTPHGEVFKANNRFFKKNPDRGIMYTPFALVLDYYHGLPFGLWNGNSVFESIEPNTADYMTQNILSMLYPHWNEYAILAKNQLTSTPFGDTADVILQNASQKVLNSYPVLILSGDIVFEKAEIEKYKCYVDNGGVLVMNSIYLEFFPEFKKDTDQKKYEVPFGNGRVIVYGDDYSIDELPSIMTELCKEFVPFEVSGDVQYLMNVKDNSIILTILNNNGVTKESDKFEVFDENETQNITVKYTGNDSIVKINEILKEETLSNSDVQNITLKPGDITIIEYTFQ